MRISSLEGVNMKIYKKIQQTVINFIDHDSLAAINLSLNKPDRIYIAKLQDNCGRIKSVDPFLWHEEISH